MSLIRISMMAEARTSIGTPEPKSIAIVAGDQELETYRNSRVCKCAVKADRRELLTSCFALDHKLIDESQDRVVVYAHCDWLKIVHSHVVATLSSNCHQLLMFPYTKAGKGKPCCSA